MFAALALVLLGGVPAEMTSAWTAAWRQGPLSAEETRAFLRALTEYVAENHWKDRPSSPQHGMIYEYFHVHRKGHVDQFVQGEALDTMHDGAWFCAGLVNAFRATGDAYYKDFLLRGPLPFYLKMLNHSDRLFAAGPSDALPTAPAWGKEWARQPGTKGFVPYFWDDGGSVSLERRIDKRPLGPLLCVDHRAGRPNPEFLLDGYSLGMSNHMAQDLGLMLELAWLLLRESTDPAERKLAAETAEAARNLHATRMLHFGPIPACAAPAALVDGDRRRLAQVPPPADERLGWTPRGHYLRLLYEAQSGTMPGFADDQQYAYYVELARAGGAISRAMAFRVIYEAYTAPLLYRAYCDDEPPPPGVNCMDLYPYKMAGGKHADYRSDRKGPKQRPKPVGSRMGPQNMVCCGWALAMLRAWPDVWDERYRREFAADLRVAIDDPLPGERGQATAKTAFTLGGAAFSLGSTREALQLEGEFTGAAMSVTLFARPDGNGNQAQLTIHRDGRINAQNDRQEPLLVQGQVTAADPQSRFHVSLPYTIAKLQKAWANGVEHGRYCIAVGGQRRNFYLLGDRAQVEARLAHELGCGLRTWQGVFREWGYIPTGMGCQSLPIGPGVTWDELSDAGGCAHLIGACAQWLHCLAGRRDWELQRVPR